MGREPVWDASPSWPVLDCHTPAFARPHSQVCAPGGPQVALPSSLQAAVRNHTLVVKVLLAHGADLEAVNDCGRFARDILGAIAPELSKLLPDIVAANSVSLHWRGCVKPALAGRLCDRPLASSEATRPNAARLAGRQDRSGRVISLPLHRDLARAARRRGQPAGQGPGESHSPDLRWQRGLAGSVAAPIAAPRLWPAESLCCCPVCG